MREIRLPLGEGIAGYVGATGETINLPDAYEDRASIRHSTPTGYRTRSMLCMPLVGRDGSRSASSRC